MTQFLRSTVENREPVAGAGQGQLNSGQIALNVHANNPFLCFLDAGGTVRRLGVWTGTSAPASPTRGELWLDITSPAAPRLRCFDGSAWSAGGASDGFPAGTRMLFQQTAAPPGWTKATTFNNRALRVVSGTAGSGGSVDFTAAFSSQGISGTIGATSLTTAQLPAHNHGISDPGHSHGVSDPGHNHGVNDPGHAHQYTKIDGQYGQSPTTGQNQATHVRQLVENWIWGEHRFTGIEIQGAGTGIGIQGAGTNIATQNTGSGQGHTHSLSGASLNLEVAYVDVIIAVKD